MTTDALDLEQKRFLYREGYVVVRGAVPAELVEAARARMRRAEKGEDLTGDPALTDLVNASSVASIMREAIGDFDPPSACQIGVLKVREPGDQFNNVGYRDRDMPYFGAELHHDGNITMAAPQTPQEGTPEEIYERFIGSGPRGALGRSADVIGHNYAPLFQDREMTLGLGSFTAFLFIALNDQTEVGRGQTMVLPRSHHLMERFFRWQRSIDGRIGPEGPGWPRLDFDAPNRCGMVYMPDAVREQLVDATSERTPDGKAWPRPTPVLMNAGDACIATYNILHSGSRNERGTESRKNIIFRLRAKSRQPGKVATGISDHPDRGWLGEWLDYEPGNNPWERSKDAMCDMWREWPGLSDVVAEARAAEAASPAG